MTVKNLADFKSSVHLLQWVASEDKFCLSDKSICLKDAKVFVLRFYVDNASNIEEIIWCFSNDISRNNYFYFSIPTYLIHNGWNTVSFNRSEFLSWGSPSWLINMATIRIHIKTKAYKPLNVKFDEVSYHTGELEKAVIIFTFDDGRLSQFMQAGRMLSDYGWAGVSFINPASVGKSGHFTFEQCKILHALGWDIANHTYSHAKLTALSSAKINAEMEQTINWLRDNGFNKGANFMAYPWSIFNSDVLREALKHCIFARTTAPAIETHPFGDNLKLRAYELNKAVSLIDAKAQVDKTVTSKGILIFVIHDLVDITSSSLDWAISNFSSLLSYISSCDVDVLTFSQYLNKYKATYAGFAEDEKSPK